MEINLSENFTYKKLIKFTMPTIFMMIFTSVYGVVDGLFVSNVAGSDAFASINLIMPVLMLVGAVGFMFGTGGSAIISKTLGEGQKEKANRYFSLFVYIEIILGVIFSLTGLIFLNPISRLLGATDEMLWYCMTYGIVMLIGMTSFILQNSFQSFLVVAERPTFGLLISFASGITNIVLDFVYIYIFRWGVFGAGFATVISQIVGSVIPLVYFLCNKDGVLKLGKTCIDFRIILKACANGSSEMVTNLSMSIVNILYNIQLMKFAGADGVSAYGIIMYVGFLFVGTYMGYSVGTAPIIGYHYGANNIDELKSLLRKSNTLLGVCAVIMTGLAEIFAQPLAYVFVGYDENLMNLTINALKIFSASYIISWFNIFASSFFTALNNGFVSALISFLRTLVFQIIMITVLPVIFDIDGIWLAVVFAELLSLIVSVICYMINKNKYGYM